MLKDIAANHSMYHGNILWSLVCLFVDTVGVSLALPIFPFFAKDDIKMTDTTYGVMQSSYAIAQMIGSLLFGYLSDLYGRKSIATGMFFWNAVCYFTLSFCKTPWELFLVRVLSGLSGCTIALTQAAVSDFTTHAKRAKFFGFLGVAIGLGYTIGPATTGSFLMKYISRESVLRVSGAICFTNSALSFFIYPTTYLNSSTTVTAAAAVDQNSISDNNLSSSLVDEQPSAIRGKPLGVNLWKTLKTAWVIVCFIFCMRMFSQMTTSFMQSVHPLLFKEAFFNSEVDSSSKIADRRLGEWMGVEGIWMILIQGWIFRRVIVQSVVSQEQGDGDSSNLVENNSHRRDSFEHEEVHDKKEIVTSILSDQSTSRISNSPLDTTTSATLNISNDKILNSPRVFYPMTIAFMLECLGALTITFSAFKSNSIVSTHYLLIIFIYGTGYSFVEPGLPWITSRVAEDICRLNTSAQNENNEQLALEKKNQDESFVYHGLFQGIVSAGRFAANIFTPAMSLFLKVEYGWLIPVYVVSVGSLLASFTFMTFTLTYHRNLLNVETSLKATKKEQID